jgi:prepilin-type N-terminal cleavage/methylation domain-containing protein
VDGFMRGFTLIELLTVVVILSVLSVIGIPIYQGYIDTTNITTVHNNLRSVYLQQQDYFVNNNAYYFTGTSCTDSAAAINTNLFSGTQVLDNAVGYTYCITQSAPTNFIARADEISGSGVLTINELNVTNF